ncbi:hypothetical protein M011DRAFT_16623 [Sporormia fimetaria CBS 119925]|uniref:ARB-07466-like C-terminal domain-containing protein n=1 Tax=Sporormia fimetaria CBS 119925 TaxID=1340428 RepID=A0A6A6VQK8_9PLEO|nr:hypothetical protein M011DRAFT_16623 [Sporormia fimetaria CBS 119925]
MHFHLFALVAIQSALGALNEPCYGSSGVAGVCVTTSACSAQGGSTINGACPRDPANVKCCTKPECGRGGNCRWTSDCAGSTVSNLCPGPSEFKCCSSNARGWGGYAAPRIPPVGACRAVAVEGARKVVDQFPGRVRDIGCVRNCPCGANPSSDHCCGRAVDLMISDRTETPTISGRQIAEWVMDNRRSLNLKYVIWGQRIWESGDRVRPWDQWTTMEDRGNVRENHWDHVHISFN